MNFKEYTEIRRENGLSTAVVHYPYLEENHGSFQPLFVSPEIEEDARNLKWYTVPWNDLRIRQPYYKRPVVDWYKREIRNGAYVLPPIARKTLSNDEYVAWGGTHRFVALWELVVHEDLSIPYLADINTLTVALSNRPAPANQKYLDSYYSLIERPS